jgi:hypothetical protein
MFGRKLLEEYNIKIIYSLEFDSYSYDTKIKYFKDVCLKLTSIFKYYNKYISQYFYKVKILEKLLTINQIIESISESENDNDIIIDTDLPSFEIIRNDENETDDINNINLELNVFINNNDCSFEEIDGDE